jgi:adenylate cyclase
MSDKRVVRRLAAILMADVVGYSRLMAEDESGTLSALKSLHKEIFAPRVREHHGRIVKLMGDGALVEFASVVDAANAAVDLQKGFAARNSDRPPDMRIVLRIGVNLGDVIIEGGDIYGDGVNLAARLQALAEPGGIALSATAYEHVAAKVGAAFRDGGKHRLKNIAAPVRVYQWTGTDTGRMPTPEYPGDAPPLPDKPSIAILPFDNMSGGSEQEYFADGVVESITAVLSRVRAFFVIARNSTFAYKGKSVSVCQIGRELGVAYVLEGSVQRAERRVRIIVQLFETAGGTHLWAEKYDGSLDDIFDLQDRIAEQVAGALQPSIRLAEIGRARRKRPQDLGAYDYTMRAIRHVWMLEKDETDRGLELLEKALEIDPDYPLALALAAWCWAQRSVYNWVEDIGTAKARARAHAEKAASLSTDDPLVLAILGAVHTFARNYGAARVLLERAVALDPNAAWALSRLGWLEVYSDNVDAARAYFEKALRLSPLDPMNFNNYVGLGSAYQVAGDNNAAADLFLRALEERPNALWIHRNLGPALKSVGREHEARASCDALMTAYPEITVQKIVEAHVFSARMLDELSEQLRALGVPEA